jgi:hypothetical protein
MNPATEIVMFELSCPHVDNYWTNEFITLFQNLAKFLVEEMGANVHHHLESYNGNKVHLPLLTLALWNDDLEMVNFLCLEHDVDVNALIQVSGRTYSCLNLALESLDR